MDSVVVKAVRQSANDLASIAPSNSRVQETCSMPLCSTALHTYLATQHCSTLAFIVYMALITAEVLRARSSDLFISINAWGYVIFGRCGDRWIGRDLTCWKLDFKASCVSCVIRASCVSCVRVVRRALSVSYGIVFFWQ